MLQGDFGTSITARQPVLDLVWAGLPATLELSLLALAIAIVLGGAMAWPAPGAWHQAEAHGCDHRLSPVGAGFSVGSGPDPAVRRVCGRVPHLGPGVSRMDLPFHDNFYLYRKRAAAAVRHHRRPAGAHVPAAPGAGDPAGRDHRATAQTIAQGNACISIM